MLTFSGTIIVETLGWLAMKLSWWLISIVLILPLENFSHQPAATYGEYFSFGSENNATIYQL
jgi:hypothetical protein